MRTRSGKTVICYVTGSAGDWGGASRVIFTCIRRLDRNRFSPLVLLPGEGPIVSELDQLGIKYVFWGELHEQNGWMSYSRDTLSAARLLKRHRVDVLHVNYSNFWRPAEVLAARLLRIPVVSHRHMVVNTPGPFLKGVRIVVAVSRFVAEAGAPVRVPTRVVYNTVDIDRYDKARSIRRELGIHEHDVVVSFIGQLREIKGLDMFIQLAHKLSRPGLVFLIAGNFRDPARFPGSYTRERLETELRGKPNIRYVGYRTDIEEIYRSSDVIVIPSQWDEPFGLISIEAGAARLPVVATRSGGLPEAILHGESGYLVAKTDFEALLHYTGELSRNAQQRREMGTVARSIVEQRFTHQPVHQLQRIYDEIAA